MVVDSLDQGDQVDVVEHHGTYRRVMTPDGREGWLHRMTLGDIVPDVAPARGSEQMGDDVLLSYLAAHVRG
jgi:SH3-like domain-containing protein